MYAFCCFSCLNDKATVSVQFRYEEAAWCTRFFTPYIWSCIYCNRFFVSQWDPSKTRLFGEYQEQGQQDQQDQQDPTMQPNAQQTGTTNQPNGDIEVAIV